MARASLSVVVAIIWAALSGQLQPNLRGAAGADDFIRVAAANIDSAQHDLLGLKPDIFKGIANLQQYAEDAQAQSEKWAGLGRLESDSQMRSISLAFRDGFLSHAGNLKRIEQLLIDLGHIGEKLETNVQLSSNLQADLKTIPVGDGQTSEILRSTKEGLGLLQRDLLRSGEELRILKQSLAQETSGIVKFNKGANELLASSGDGQDNVKKWKNEVIKTAVEQNKKEGSQISNVSSLAARMTQILLTLAEATKAQQKFVNGAR